MGLSWFEPTYSFLVTGDTQCLDVEHIAEAGNENHICITTQLCIAIATSAKCSLYLCFHLNTLLYHSAKSKSYIISINLDK